MVNLNVHPAFLLNNYVWQLLKNNTPTTGLAKMEEVNYGNRSAIIPANMEPEFTAYNKPFLVYGYSDDGTVDLYAQSAGSLSYAVWSTSVGEITTILNIIKTALERHDESAREVNSYTSTIPMFVGIRFGDIYISYLEGPSPEESEGGRQAGIITIRYDYFTEIEVKRPVVTNGNVTWQ